jgi:hypothetical protein
MRVLIALLCVSCIGEPPEPDEVQCLWQRQETYAAPADGCLRFIGSAHLKLASDACEAQAAPVCAVLQPNESLGVYTNKFGENFSDVVVGDCGDPALDCP